MPGDIAIPSIAGPQDETAPDGALTADDGPGIDSGPSPDGGAETDGGSVTEGGHEAVPRRMSWAPSWLPAISVLVGATAVTVALNLWWVATHRRHLPFDIDEAGYLQRAVRDSDALHSGGLAQWFHVVHSADPQAPLLPVVTGFVRYLTGAGPVGLIGVEQLFVVVLVVATYLATRQLTQRRWAVLAAIVVMAVPGVEIRSHQYDFAVPAAAMLAAALAAQLCARDFRSTPRTLVWGAVLGLATLSRTMVLGLLAALVLTGGIRLVAGRAGWRQFANVGAGLLVGFLVAFSWYSASWHTVLRYLTSYGYGSNAAGYGPSHSVFSTIWWTNRFTQAVGTEVLFPTALAILVCSLFAVVGIVGRRYARARSRPGSPTREQPETPRFAWFASPTATVTVFLVVCYLLLSSTRNVGSGFMLPLVPPAIILVIALASRVPRVAWPVAVTVCGVAAAFSLVAQNSLLPGSTSTIRSMRFGPVSMPVFVSEGSLLIYAQSTFAGCQNGCITHRTFVPNTNDLRGWLTADDRAAVMLETDATERGRLPVVVFGVQDPFFNTNTVDLAYQLDYHQALPTGLMRPQSQAGASLLGQLESPQFGEPNIVIVGSPGVAKAAQAFTPLTNPKPTVAALRAAGFTPIDRLRLPDGRVMALWWKLRGPPAPAPGHGG